jgi:hypothetical protein
MTRYVMWVQRVVFLPNLLLERGGYGLAYDSIRRINLCRYHNVTTHLMKQQLQTETKLQLVDSEQNQIRTDGAFSSRVAVLLMVLETNVIDHQQGEQICHVMILCFRNQHIYEEIISNNAS